MIIRSLVSAVLWMIILSPINSQDCLERILLEYKIDSLLANGDSINVFTPFEKMKTLDCYIRGWQHYEMAELYLQAGREREARKEIKTSIIKGYLNAQISDFSEDQILSQLSTDYDSLFSKEMLSLSVECQEKIWIENREILIDLVEILAIDQGLRKKTLLKRTTGIDYSRRFGYPIDTTVSSTIVDDLGLFKRELDSMNLQKYVDVVLKLGHLPDERFTQNLIFTHVLAIHTSGYQFPQEYQDIVRSSVTTNHFSPHYYGWYYGYKMENTKQDYYYYYTMAGMT